MTLWDSIVWGKGENGMEMAFVTSEADKGTQETSRREYSPQPVRALEGKGSDEADESDANRFGSLGGTVRLRISSAQGGGTHVRAGTGAAGRRDSGGGGSLGASLGAGRSRGSRGSNAATAGGGAGSSAGGSTGDHAGAGAGSSGGRGGGGGGSTASVGRGVGGSLRRRVCGRVRGRVGTVGRGVSGSVGDGAVSGGVSRGGGGAGRVLSRGAAAQRLEALDGVREEGRG